MRKEPIFLNKSAEKYLFKNHKYKSNDLVESCPNKTYTSKILRIMIEIRIKRKIYFILQVKVKVIGYQIK